MYAITFLEVINAWNLSTCLYAFSFIKVSTASTSIDIIIKAAANYFAYRTLTWKMYNVLESTDVSISTLMSPIRMISE